MPRPSTSVKEMVELEIYVVTLGTSKFQANPCILSSDWAALCPFFFEPVSIVLMMAFLTV